MSLNHKRLSLLVATLTILALPVFVSAQPTLIGDMDPISIGPQGLSPEVSVSAHFDSPPNGTVVTSPSFPVSQQICGTVTANASDQICVMLVLDVSGSMSAGLSGGSTRLDQLRNSVKGMLDDLDPTKTKVGIVQFGHQADGSDGAMLVSELTDDFDGLKSALDGMYAGGRTPTGDGMAIATSQLSKYSDPGCAQYQVVASDGYWNLGSDPTTVATSAHNTFGQTVHTIGISADHNAAKMMEIASAGGGSYFDATDPNALDNIFGSNGGFVGVDSALLNGTDITSELNAFGQFCVDRDIYEGQNDFLLEGFAGESYASDNLTIYGEMRDPNPAIPEPATMLMFGLGALGLAASRYRRK